jgi:hypothetical protein
VNEEQTAFSDTLSAKTDITSRQRREVAGPEGARTSPPGPLSHGERGRRNGCRYGIATSNHRSPVYRRGGSRTARVTKRIPKSCRGDRPVPHVFAPKISSHEGTKGNTAISRQPSAVGLNQEQPINVSAVELHTLSNRLYSLREGERLENQVRTSNSRSTSPQIPCLRRVPFEATKRNQKSPLGAGPAICTARTHSQDAHNPLP